MQSITPLPRPEYKSRKEMIDLLLDTIDKLKDEKCTYLEIITNTNGLESSKVVLDGVYSCRPRCNG